MKYDDCFKTYKNTTKCYDLMYNLVELADGSSESYYAIDTGENNIIESNQEILYCSKEMCIKSFFYSQKSLFKTIEKHKLKRTILFSFSKKSEVINEFSEYLV